MSEKGRLLVADAPFLTTKTFRESPMGDSKARASAEERQCSVCSAIFVVSNGRKKTCSPACAFTHDRNRAREYARKKSKNRVVKPKTVSTCRVCGAAYEHYRSTKGVCSRKCYKAIWQRPTRAVLAPVLAKSIRFCRHCDCSFTPATYQQTHCSKRCKHKSKTRARALRYVAKRHAEATCPVCEKPYTKRDKRQVGCSVECGNKISSRVSHARRRAAKMTRDCEKIDPFEIFGLARWVCQICGVETPQRLRGKNLPESPELDHIIPLSRGGTHTAANLQCVCRRCNLRKGRKLMSEITFRKPFAVD